MATFTYLYLLRVPLLCAFATAALAPLGAFGNSPLRGMLQGLFDLGPARAAWTGAAAAMMAAASMACQRLVLDHSRQRCRGVSRAPRWLHRTIPAVCLGAPLPVLAGIAAVSGWKSAGAAAFTACGLLAALALIRFQLSWPDATASVLLRPLALLSPDGYRNGPRGPVLRGHVVALRWAAFFAALYALAGWLKYRDLQSWFGQSSLLLPPALAYVLLLNGLLCWLLAGLAFFFDRFRIPVLLPWIAMLALSSVREQNEPTFAATPVCTRTPVSPRRVLAATRTATPILVCASGGGIQAAAWTAKVLTELERANPVDFSTSVRLISATSGGSVGGLHFAAAYRNGFVSSAGLDRINSRAARSTLDAVAWGLTGPDFLRAIAGGWNPIRANRGWALERAMDPEFDYPASFAAWRADAAHGTRPSVVFNATVVETGQRIALGTVDYPQEADLPTLRSLLELETSPGAAARLSASFPYVTPAAAPSTGDRLHLVDGGYYDNYGVGAAIAFLDSAGTLPPNLLLIEIRASASIRGVAAQPASPPLFQWLAPVLTMIHVRDAAQRSRNDAELDLLTRALAAKGTRLHRVVFEFPDADVPLSWHLTAAQNERIHAAWRARFADSAELEGVRRHLAHNAASHSRVQ